MPWPIPTLSKIEYPKPISRRLWLPILVAIALGAAAAVLLLWPHGKPTNTLQFWCTLVGAPLAACALVFGIKLDLWEDHQTDAEELENEQHRLGGMWREWARRHLSVVDVAAFPAATDEIAQFADARAGLPSTKERNVTFDWVKGRGAAFRRSRVLHLVAVHFAEALRTRKEVLVTLMLNNASLEHAEAWTRDAERFFRRTAPGVTFRIDAQAASDCAEWIARQVDRLDVATRLIIAVQLWAEDGSDPTFSEGAAAFLVEPGVTNSGSVFRPIASMPDTLELGLSQITHTQISPDRLTHLWSTGGNADDSSALRSVLKADPKDPVTEHVLDSALGNPGPASGWIALAIAMEAMRGAGPQLVAWRVPESERESESLYLCAVSPVPQKETTV